MSQYLYRENWLDDDDVEIVVKKAGKVVPLTNPSELVETVAEWRKAYQIHYWFQKSYTAKGGGEIDDDTRVYVDVEDIKELLNVVDAVLKDKSKASELLPYSPEDIDYWRTFDVEYHGRKTPRDSEEFYGEHYYWQLEDTKAMLEKIVEQHDSRVLSSSSYYRYEVSQ